MTLFADTGADISVLPYQFAKGLPRIQLTTPINVSGFKDSATHRVTEGVELTIFFRPGVLKKAFFYLMDTNHAILGNDLLRNKDHDLSLMTGHDCLRVGDDFVYTKPTVEESRREYRRRIACGVENYRLHTFRYRDTIALMRAKECTIIPAKSTVYIPAYVQWDETISGEHTFLSRFEGCAANPILGEDIGIASITYDKPQTKYEIPAFNSTNKDYFFDKDAVLGDIVSHDNIHRKRQDFEIFSLAEVLSEIRFREKEEALKEQSFSTNSPSAAAASSTAAASSPAAASAAASSPAAATAAASSASASRFSADPSSSAESPAADKTSSASFPTTSAFHGAPKKKVTIHMATASPSTNDSADDVDRPVKFSDLVGQQRLEDETLEQCRRNGVEIDLQAPVKAPNIEMPRIATLDHAFVERERKKSENCPYWKDKDVFLSKFNFKDMPQELIKPVSDLLWSFCHVFYNDAHPEQFHEGIRHTPIKIERLPGRTPRKERMRTMSSKKLELLQKHITDFVDRQIIEEIESGSTIGTAYASPIHIVVEKRFVASQNTVVEKSRFTADMRAINETLSASSYPLPDMNKFREEVASEGFKIFSNFDAQTFFYQIKLDRDTAAQNFSIYAMEKLFFFLRLAMGFKGSPCIAQFISDTAFEKHQHCKTFIDDFTTYSKDTKEHLEEDVPKTLACASFYNILLSPSKADLFRSSCRVLGHQISENSMSLSNEKVEKIASLTFPADKKELVSRLAFFQYFARIVPRLSEILSPLRRMASARIRFKPTDEHRAAFEEAKTYLLNPTVNCIRMPSQRQEDTLILWTDASANSISALLTQMLPPIGGGKKQLCIVGCFSSTIQPSWSLWPIWLLELVALYEATRKWARILAARSFYCAVDSRTVQFWCSLELVPRDLARRILALQRYNYKLLWVESRINAADAFTRSGLEPPPEGKFPRFLRARIFNSKGEVVPWELLFSKEKAREASEFFKKSRHQALVRVHEEEEEQEEQAEEEEECFLFDCDHEVVVDEKPATESTKLLEYETIESIYRTVNAVTFVDGELEEGRVEEEEEGEPDDSVLENLQLPIFPENLLEKIQELQQDDILSKCKEYLSQQLPTPSKYQSALLTPNIRSFLRHRSLYRLTSQNILVRVWVSPARQTTAAKDFALKISGAKDLQPATAPIVFETGKAQFLVCVGEAQIRQLIDEIHRFSPGKMNDLSHCGKNKTFAAICQTYYAFKLRQLVDEIVSKCAVCRLNNVTITHRNDTGLSLPNRPMEVFVIDHKGPMHGLGASASGKPRYVFGAIDAFSRYLVTSVTTSTDDASTLKCLVNLRNTLSGLPDVIQADNALLKPGTQSAKFLREHNCGIRHGSPSVSRHQTAVERAFGTIGPLINKLHTDCPTTPFEQLVSEATIIHNCTHHESLPMHHSPKLLHFQRAPKNFLRTDLVDEAGPKRWSAMRATARETERHALEFQLAAHLRRRDEDAPTDYSRRLRVGDYVLRKRTSFPAGAVRKQAHKVNLDGFQITSRLATNVFSCTSVLDASVSIIPGDLLVRVRGQTDQSMKQLVESMILVSERNAQKDSKRQTRSASKRDISTLNCFELSTSNQKASFDRVCELLWFP